MTSDKIVILGAGHVGSHCAQALALRGVGEEIVLVDILPEKARAQALDIADSLSFEDHRTVVRSGDYSDCGDAALVVVAIGESRLPGQTRLDLLDRSVVMLDTLVEQLHPYRIACPVITITNPADIVADYLRKALCLPRARCFSTGTLLDTARLVRILSEQTGVDRRSITAYAIGEHGDSATAALSSACIGAVPLAHLGLDRAELLRQMRDCGMVIVRGKGSTEFGIGRALCTLAQCILRDEKRIMPLSVLLQGEYGQTNVHCGVPCRVGRNGVEEIIELPLTQKENEELGRSCDIIRAHIARAEQVHARNIASTPITGHPKA